MLNEEKPKMSVVCEEVFLAVMDDFKDRISIFEAYSYDQRGDKPRESVARWQIDKPKEYFSFRIDIGGTTEYFVNDKYV